MVNLLVTMRKALFPRSLALFLILVVKAPKNLLVTVAAFSHVTRQNPLIFKKLLLVVLELEDKSSKFIKIYEV